MSINDVIREAVQSGKPVSRVLEDNTGLTDLPLVESSLLTVSSSGGIFMPVPHSETIVQQAAGPAPAMVLPYSLDGCISGSFNPGAQTEIFSPGAFLEQDESDSGAYTKKIRTAEYNFEITDGKIFGIHNQERKKSQEYVADIFVLSGVFVDAHGDWVAKEIRTSANKLLVVDRSTIFCEPAELLRSLVAHGHNVSIAPNGQRMLQAYLGMAPTKDIVRILRVDRPGWHWSLEFGDAYSQQRFSVAKNGVIPPVLKGCASDTEIRFTMSVEAWGEAIGRHCRGNSRLIMAICFALSGALLGKYGLNGCCLHLFGDSSSGKTTILHIAASLCCGGTERSLGSCSITPNALEIELAARNDYFYTIDEISQLAPKDLYEAIYRMGNGVLKRRKTEQLDDRMAKFKTAVVSTGERSISNMLSATRYAHAAGLAVRSLDLPAEPYGGFGVFEAVGLEFASPAQLSEHLKWCSEKGSEVYVEFIRYLIQTPNWKNVADDTISRFEKEADVASRGGQVRRAMQYFALSAATGELAIQARVLPFQVGSAYQACRNCFCDWYENHVTQTFSAEDRILERLHMMLRQEGQSKFLAYQLCGTDRELGGAYGYRHVNNGVRQLILPKEGFEAVFRGMDPHLARKTLAKKGMLEKAGRDLQVYRALPGSGKTKCTVINLPMDFTPEASIL